MSRYIVEVADCAGTFSEREYPTFPEALARVAEARGKWRDKAVIVYNAERCDVGSSGLTEDEQEALAEVT